MVAELFMLGTPGRRWSGGCGGSLHLLRSGRVGGEYESWRSLYCSSGPRPSFPAYRCRPRAEFALSSSKALV